MKKGECSFSDDEVELSFEETSERIEQNPFEEFEE